MGTTRALLGRTAENRSHVGPVELFFDLVYVFAIVQLSHLLIEHLDWVGAAQTVIVFAAVWWGWNYTAWVMNWLDALAHAGAATQRRADVRRARDVRRDPVSRSATVR